MSEHKKVAFLTGNSNTDIHDIAKELAKWGQIDVYVNNYEGVKDNVNYFSNKNWPSSPHKYDYCVVVDSLSPFLDNTMMGDIFIWLKTTINLLWQDVNIGQALLYNVNTIVKGWITSFETTGLNNVKDIKSVEEWKNLFGLNFEMEYKDVISKELSKPENNSYFLHSAELLGDKQI